MHSKASPAMPRRSWAGPVNWEERRARGRCLASVQALAACPVASAAARVSAGSLRRDDALSARGCEGGCVSVWLRCRSADNGRMGNMQGQDARLHGSQGRASSTRTAAPVLHLTEGTAMETGRTCRDPVSEPNPRPGTCALMYALPCRVVETWSSAARPFSRSARCCGTWGGEVEHKLASGGGEQLC